VLFRSESGNEKAVCDYLAEFAVARNLKYYTDSSNNAVIWKPASAGCESAASVMIQSHIDMVAVKEEGSSHDFSKDPLKLIVDGDKLTADGTSLGADNGIGVAYILALLDDNEQKLPAIEAVFTSSEETGMDGAKALDESVLSARRMVNLDWEEEGEIACGCAGGIFIDVSKEIQRTSMVGAVCREIRIDGLQGGHSALVPMRGNAIKLLARSLHGLSKQLDIGIVSLEGGTAVNVVPKQASAVISIAKQDIPAAARILAEMEGIFRKEYFVMDPDIRVSLNDTDVDASEIFSLGFAKSLLDVFMYLPTGIVDMSYAVPDLIETSINIGVLEVDGGKVSIRSCLRSSMPSKMAYLTEQLCSVVERYGWDINLYNEYPSWEYRHDSPLREAFSKAYKDMFGEDAKICATHGGLECGLFNLKLPDIDMIALGPTIKDVHSTEESVSLSSLQRTWEYLSKALSDLV
jgi:dipeptidase D